MHFFSREIEVESEDETLYQSKRSSQRRRDQHSSLPDLTEPLPSSNDAYEETQTVDGIEPSASVSSIELGLPVAPNTSSPSHNSKQHLN